MEPPVGFDATAIRDEKAKVLRSIPAMPADDVRDLPSEDNTGRALLLVKLCPAIARRPGVDPESSSRDLRGA